MDLNELWIGDKVIVRPKNKEGIFEGINKAGKARVRIGIKIYLIHASNIDLADTSDEMYKVQPEYEETPIPDIEQKSKPPTRKLSNHHNSIIDLHIEKLNKGLENAHPVLILEYQMQKCKEFIEDSIQTKKTVVTIIHGKGKGTLRNDVLDMLKDYGNIKFTIEVNQGGAQEVWFNY